jgi:serine/threonine-protein kinase HipA
LFAAGSSPGGARPKALVHDAGIEYIAKFPSKALDEGLDAVAVEAVSLELARRAGLVVPDFHLITLGARRTLLVRRFDVTAAGGRRHMISLQTLCLERPGAWVTDYGTACEAVRKYTSDPAADVPSFYRHVVFNAVLGNTDDHLKNFLMLRDERGLRLSAAFDLLPDIGRRREHVLAFGLHATAPDRVTLLALAKQWGVRGGDGIVDDVCAAVTQFEAVAGDARVPVADIRRLAPDVRARVERVGAR